jgi:hypothetical protein
MVATMVAVSQHDPRLTPVAPPRRPVRCAPCGLYTVRCALRSHAPAPDAPCPRPSQLGRRAAVAQWGLSPLTLLSPLSPTFNSTALAPLIVHLHTDRDVYILSCRCICYTLYKTKTSALDTSLTLAAAGVRRPYTSIYRKRSGCAAAAACRSTAAARGACCVYVLSWRIDYL